MPVVLTKPKIGPAGGVGGECPICPCVHGQKVRCDRCGLFVCRQCSTAWIKTEYHPENHVEGEYVVRVCKRCVKTGGRP